MKFLNQIKIALVGLVALVAVPAFAQVGFDTYAQLRTVVVMPPTIIAPPNPATTNNPVDLHGFEGTAKIDITSLTNAGGALTVQPYTSPDLTNWTALANYSLAQTATVIYTNGYYGGTNLTATNTYNRAGVTTTPTASTAGFATAYVDASSPFTNSGATTITSKKTYTIGYQIQDAGRYLILVFTPTGTSSNDIVSATLTARKQQE